MVLHVKLQLLGQPRRGQVRPLRLLMAHCRRSLQQRLLLKSLALHVMQLQRLPVRLRLQDLGHRMGRWPGMLQGASSVSHMVCGTNAVNVASSSWMHICRQLDA